GDNPGTETFPICNPPIFDCPTMSIHSGDTVDFEAMPGTSLEGTETIVDFPDDTMAMVVLGDAQSIGVQVDGQPGTHVIAAVGYGTNGKLCRTECPLTIVAP